MVKVMVVMRVSVFQWLQMLGGGGEWHEMEKFKKLFYSSKTFFLNIETVLPCVLNPCLSCLFK